MFGPSEPVEFAAPPWAPPMRSTPASTSVSEVSWPLALTKEKRSKRVAYFAEITQLFSSDPNGMNLSCNILSQ